MALHPLTALGFVLGAFGALLFVCERLRARARRRAQARTD